MERLKNTLILLLVAGIPAAAPPLFTAPASLCFTAGSITYQVTPTARVADTKVKFDAAAADLRIGLVDSVEAADFALVDDVGSAGACAPAGGTRTVAIVGAADAADFTVSLARDPAETDVKLFVHSARFGHREAAALLAAMRRDESSAGSRER